jgi:hypothetical protein
VCPAAIQSHQCPVFVRQKNVVLWAEDLAAKGFENDAAFWKGSRRFVQRQVSSLRCQNGRVLPRVVLRKPQCMHGYSIQLITPCR